MYNVIIFGKRLITLYFNYIQPSLNTYISMHRHIPNYAVVKFLNMQGKMNFAEVSTECMVNSVCVGGTQSFVFVEGTHSLRTEMD
jgi:hypothetical protein